jgi:hypothetical protein
MRTVLVVLVGLMLLAGPGCGGAGERGKNSAKDDRPKAAKDEG